MRYTEGLMVKALYNSSYNIRSLEVIISAGANVDAPGQSQETLLMIAVRYYDASRNNNEYYKFARFLIEHGADVNLPFQYDSEYDGKNARGSIFTYAIEQNTCGYNGLVQLMINRGIGINKPTIDCGTPLTAAIRYGNKDVIDLLLAHDDIDVNKLNEEKMNPLGEALSKGNIDLIERLLARDDIDVNKIALYGYTPLVAAAEEDDIGLIERLLARDDIDVNAQCKGGETPLTLAISEGNIAVIERLLARDDIDVNKIGLKEKLPIIAQYKGGETPLTLAISKGNIAVIELLLAHPKIDVNQIGLDGKLPIMWPLELDQAELTGRLLRQGADLHVPDQGGHSALDLVHQNGKKKNLASIFIADFDANQQF